MRPRIVNNPETPTDTELISLNVSSDAVKNAISCAFKVGIVPEISWLARSGLPTPAAPERGPGSTAVITGSWFGRSQRRCQSRDYRKRIGSGGDVRRTRHSEREATTQHRFQNNLWKYCNAFHRECLSCQILSMPIRSRLRAAKNSEYLSVKGRFLWGADPALTASTDEGLPASLQSARAALNQATNRAEG